MEISRNSRLFRLAYHYRTADERPKQVSLCLLFWRVVAHALLFPIVYVLGVLIGGTALVYVTIVNGTRPIRDRLDNWGDKRWEQRYDRRIKRRADKAARLERGEYTFAELLFLFLKAGKERVCPIITVK